MNKFQSGDSVYVKSGIHKSERGVILEEPTDLTDGNYVVCLEHFLQGAWVKEEEMNPGFGKEWLTGSAYNMKRDYPNGIDPYEYFMSQVRINNKAAKKFQLSCDIFPREGMVPHFHIKFNDDPQNIAYICIGKAEYAPQHKDSTKRLNSKERRILQNYMQSATGSFHQDAEGNMVSTTSWYDGYDRWADFHIDDDMHKYITFDSKGNPVMPDYNTLN